MQRKEGTVPLGSLFEKYKNLLVPPERSVIKTFCEVVEEVCAFSIEPNSVRYSVYTKTITLSVPGALKQHLLVHQKELLAHLKGRLGDRAPQTIL